MTTSVATCGDSATRRIPGKVLRRTSLRQDDEVEVSVNERGNVKIASSGGGHRHVSPARGVTLATIFAGYAGGRSGPDAWPSDDMAGAEWEAWSQ